MHVKDCIPVGIALVVIRRQPDFDSYGALMNCDGTLGK